MRIQNKNFWRKWYNLQQYLTGEHELVEKQYGLVVDEQFIIAGKTYKMRPLGQLDWAWYTSKTLATAMNENRVLEYYEKMLKDDRSNRNIWKRPEEEMQKKTHYASLSGRAEFIDSLDEVKKWK